MKNTSYRMSDLARVLARPLTLALLILVSLSASRLLLIALFWNRVEPTGGVSFILAQGIRFDLILIGILIGPVLLFKPFFHTRPGLIKAGRWLWSLYLGAAVSFMFFVESATFSFIREYDSRPNYLFVEYLRYPKELLATLAGSHLFELIAFNLITVLLFYAVTRWVKNDPAGKQQLPLGLCLLASPVIAVVVVMMIRSTLDHRPVNPSIAAFSPDSMVNQLALNSPYSLLYAVYEQHRDDKAGKVRYGVMDEQQVIERILKDAGLDNSPIRHPDSPSWHLQTPTRKYRQPQNIVIVLEESLGAEYVHSLGGKKLTPWLDQAATEGIWMERLYATGTRSVRGIEAVLTGFTPTSKRSVVKLRKTQEHFFTLASLLKRKGYETSFIYGGEAHFDNMKRFFLNNGFQSVVDEKDFKNPMFVAAWGVSDEDLFQRAHEYFSRAREKPFFSLVFTSSNHDPFDIPPNRVEPEPGTDGARETAVKYADYALGRFFEKARKSAYWDNTVFLVIADHNSRVYGNQLVPIERFHIPGLIIGGNITPRKIPGITSQIDMLPTLLSLAGVEAEHPGIGRDLTLPPFENGAGRAIMQFNQIAAYLVPGRAIIMQPDLPIQSFLYHPGGILEPDPEPDVELEKTALAYALFGPLAIRNHWYPDQITQ